MALALGTIGILSACGEQPVQPSVGIAVSDESNMDSTEMRWLAQEHPQPPPGLMLAPVVGDSLLLGAATDSIQVQLTSRECAAPSNRITILSPETATLSTTMCQEPVDTIWSLLSGPFWSGEAILIEFESGAFGGDIDGQMQVSGAFPQWTASFEDGIDDDFDDFVLLVTAFPPDTMFMISLEANDSTLHPWTRRTTFVADDTLFQQDSIPSDTASLTITTSFNEQFEAPSQPIALSARFLPGSGGHVHIEDTLHLDSASVVGAEANNFANGMVGRPLWGFFRKDTTGSSSVTDTTDAEGVSKVKFAAGFVGGEVAIIASATWNSMTVADTLVLQLRSGTFGDLWGP